MKRGLLIIAMFLTLGTQAKVIVKGHALSTSGKPIANAVFVVEKVMDFLTYKREIIAQGKSGPNGDFSVDFELDYTAFVILKFPKVERTFYAVPGKGYYIDIKAPMEALSKETSRYGKDVRTAYIVNHHPTELNFLIDTLDYACSKFLHEEIDGRKSKPAIDAFFKSLENKFKDVESAYFRDYLKYKQAEFYLFIFKKKRQEFAAKYFESEENIALHIQKMHVFSSFFNGNMKYDILINDKHPFHLAFQSGDLEECLKTVYPFQGQSRELRELVLLKGLQEVYSTKQFKESNINYLLDRIIRESNYAQHKIIAQNIKSGVTHLKENYPAPPLAVTGLEAFDISKMRGKYIYLFFFRTWDATLTSELPNIKALQNQFGDELHVVGVCVDESKESYQKFKAAGPYNWTCLHYNFQTEILDQWQIEDFRIDRYEVESMIAYYLIDPQGNLIFSPAKAPSKGFIADFGDIIRK